MTAVPRRAAFLAVLVALAIVSAGCLSGGETSVTTSLDRDPGGTGGNNTTTTDGGDNTTSGPSDDTGGSDDGTDDNETDIEGGTGNNTTGSDTNNTTDPQEHEWPPLDEALVRPGVQHVTDGGQCTINFVYRSPVNQTLYLGTAAHCVDSIGIGENSTVRDVNGKTAFKAPVAFNAWHALGFEPADEDVGDDVHHFDFALLEVPAEHADKVHPAVLHFGGPTRTGTAEDAKVLKKVIGYGASGLRLVAGPGDWHEGYITGTSDNGWSLHVYTVLPGIPGDSGSGIMSADGAALGAASTIAFAPIPGENTFSSVPMALAWLDDNDWPLELQTWELLNGPLSPV